MRNTVLLTLRFLKDWKSMLTDNSLLKISPLSNNVRLNGKSLGLSGTSTSSKCTSIQ